MRALVFGGAVALGVVCSPAIAQQTRDPVWERQGWQVYEMHNGGRFIGCFVSKGFTQRGVAQEGVRIVLAHYRDDRWAALLQGERARTLGTSSVELSVDGRALLTGSLVPDDTGTARRLGTLSFAAIDALVAAERLELASQSDRFSISLEGSEHALRRTSQCVWEGAARELQSAGAGSPRPQFRVLNVLSNNVLNMRSGPSARASLVTPIPVGERRLQLVGECRQPDSGSSPFGWCQVRWRDYVGWVSIGGLMPDIPPVIVTSSINQQPKAAPPPPAATQAQPATPKQERSFSSGTGFVVSKSGHILTNAHVVSGCSMLAISQPGTVRPTEAAILATDRNNDLAILTASTADLPPPIRFRRQVRLGEDIAVFGFPFAGTVTSMGNFTRGTVSALAGLQDDTSLMQVAAPVQPGNSGGPVLDVFGNAIGVVVGKLNWRKTVSEGGSLPEQVNFAIKASTALQFLDANGVNVNEHAAAEKMDGPELAEHAKRVSVFIACVK